MAEIGPYQKLRVLLNKQGAGLQGVPETTPEEKEGIEKEYFEDVAGAVAGSINPVKKLSAVLPETKTAVRPFERVRQAVRGTGSEMELPKPHIDMPLEQIRQETNLLWEIAPNSDKAKRATEILNKKMDFEARKKIQGL